MLTAVIAGHPYNVHFHRITALDAGAYRQEAGEILDDRIAQLIVTGQRLEADHGDLADESWRLEDAALIVWLWGRQNQAEPKSVADVFRSVTLTPAPESAGDSGAPEAD